MKTIDTRGKLCPAPLMMTRQAIKEAVTGEKIEVITDNETACSNLLHYLDELKITGVHTSEQDNIKRICFEIPEHADDQTDMEPLCPTPGKNTRTGYVVVIKSDRMGTGDDELGHILMRAFINSLSEADTLPDSIILYNSGIHTALRNTDTAASLRKLEDKGITIYACGTCLDYYGVKDQLAIGVISNMYKITQLVTQTSHVVYP